MALTTLHAFVMANFRVRGRIYKMSVGHLVPESKQEQNDGDNIKDTGGS